MGRREATKGLAVLFVLLLVSAVCGEDCAGLACADQKDLATGRRLLWAPGQGSFQDFLQGLFGGNWTDHVPGAWHSPGFTWDHLGSFEYQSSLLAFLDAANFTKPQSLGELKMKLDTMADQFCTPEEFTPAQKAFAACTGPTVTLEYVPKVCILDEELKQVLCDPPKLVLRKTPGACTHSYVTASQWKGKECKVETSVGVSKSIVLVGGRSHIKLLVCKPEDNCGGVRPVCACPYAAPICAGVPGRCVQNASFVPQTRFSLHLPGYTPASFRPQQQQEFKQTVIELAAASSDFPEGLIEAYIISVNPSNSIVVEAKAIFKENSTMAVAAASDFAAALQDPATLQQAFAGATLLSVVVEEAVFPLCTVSGDCRSSCTCPSDQPICSLGSGICKAYPSAVCSGTGFDCGREGDCVCPLGSKCKNGNACVECTRNSDCKTERNVCDLNTNACIKLCGTDETCGTIECDCPSDKPACSGSPARCTSSQVFVPETRYTVRLDSFEPATFGPTEQAEFIRITRENAALLTGWPLDLILVFIANIQPGSALVETVVVFLDASQSAQQAAQTFADKVQDTPTFEVIYVPTVWGTASVSGVAVNEAQVDTCSTTNNCFVAGCACSGGNACVANAQGIGECRAQCPSVSGTCPNDCACPAAQPVCSQGQCKAFCASGGTVQCTTDPTTSPCLCPPTTPDCVGGTCTFGVCTNVGALKCSGGVSASQTCRCGVGQECDAAGTSCECVIGNEADYTCGASGSLSSGQCACPTDTECFVGTGNCLAVCALGGVCNTTDPQCRCVDTNQECQASNICLLSKTFEGGFIEVTSINQFTASPGYNSWTIVELNPNTNPTDRATIKDLASEVALDSSQSALTTSPPGGISSALKLFTLALNSDRVDVSVDYPASGSIPAGIFNGMPLPDFITKLSAIKYNFYLAQNNGVTGPSIKFKVFSTQPAAASSGTTQFTQFVWDPSNNPTSGSVNPLKQWLSYNIAPTSGLGTAPNVAPANGGTGWFQSRLTAGGAVLNGVSGAKRSLQAWDTYFKTAEPNFWNNAWVGALVIGVGSSNPNTVTYVNNVEVASTDGYNWKWIFVVPTMAGP